jgi:hypothetical protein
MSTISAMLTSLSMIAILSVPIIEMPAQSKPALSKSKHRASKAKSSSKSKKPPTVIPAYVLKAVKLRPTTPAEAEANAVWSLRAALNIAALQCGSRPFLASVQVYNNVLAQHAEELDRARLTMSGHFTRYDGKRGATTFDQYFTKTYNSFSTVNDQEEFCDRSGLSGRRAMATAKGGLGALAIVLVPYIRAAFEPGAGLPPSLRIIDIKQRIIPNLSE